jgi:hypothetical protein
MEQGKKVGYDHDWIGMRRAEILNSEFAIESGRLRLAAAVEELTTRRYKKKTEADLRAELAIAKQELTVAKSDKRKTDTKLRKSLRAGVQKDKKLVRVAAQKDAALAKVAKLRKRKKATKTSTKKQRKSKTKKPRTKR